MAENDIRIGIIGGTGLGAKLGLEAGEQREIDTPFGKPSSPITLTHWEGVPIALIQRHGPGHLLKPSEVPYRANIYALKAIGVTHILASGAVGSLREEICPGDLVVVDQVIDKTFDRPRTFYENAAAVHVEFGEPFCPVMRNWLLDVAWAMNEDDPQHRIRIHDGGTYVCMEGPAFSTRAESLMHRQWGGDLIGMTVMPEAKLAREAEIAYAMIAMSTDYDCWRQGGEGNGEAADEQTLLAEIMGNLEKATANNLRLMKAALAQLDALQARPSPAHSALKLAIWSDKSRIDPEQVQKLDVLWGRYFNVSETR